jgi:prolyl oligopeptidase
MNRIVLALALFATACATSSSNAPAAAPVAAVVIPAPSPTAPVVEDPNLWLEEVEGEKPLAWVNAQNAISTRVLRNGEQESLKKRLRSIYDSQENIPVSYKRGKYLYNFWQDAEHVRGLWRRTTLEQLRKKQPQWEAVLDVDELAKNEHENWVYKGVAWLQPSHTRALVSLSRGGGDAVVVRELDAIKKAFIPTGFTLPEAKSEVSWKDENTLFVGTDFGPDSLTSSGYPRFTKLWKRGTPLSEAKTIYEAPASDVAVSAERDWHQGRHIDVVQRAITFFTNELYFIDGDKVAKLDKPDDVDASFFGDFVLFRLRTDWSLDGTTWPAGALLAAPLADYRAGKHKLEMIYTPAKNRSLSDVDATKNALLLDVLEDVHTKLYAARFEQGKWSQVELAGAGLGTARIFGYDDNEGDRYWVMPSDFISPAKLELGELKSPARETIRTAPAFFDATGLEVKQFFATSKDGTRVPYFQVSKQNMALDGSSPTLLTGYGGFEISLTPSYNASAGAAWLEKGGVYVQANIRGGGEYGPAWHEAALKLNRQRAYDDFIAVAEDLIARKVTQPKKLGIQGRSNGGLLMGVMFTEPDLWGAVVCSVPLLDMKRYNQLLAGASWMGEYGDPAVAEEWAALAKYSPYQNVRKDTHYPRILFTTSTRDDRVHPGHARKMVARMLEQGHDVLYFENTEGGHAGAANNEQRADMTSLEYVYLYQQLMK